MKKSKVSKKTILVTGVAGFMGSDFINYAVIKYPRYNFVGIDSLTGVSDKNNIEVRDKNNFVFVRVDIRDRTELQKIFHEYKPTDVIHFAAETHVDLSIKNPIIFSETNVNGTNNLLYLSKMYKISRFHFISTDEVYGSLKLGDKSWTETSPTSPNNPYSASKAAAELFALSYHKTFGMDIVITRSSNNFGPRQDRTKMIPLFISKLLKKEKIPLYGKGLQMRDWLYVRDHSIAVDHVFHKGKQGEIYNVTGGNEMRNIDLVKKLLKLFGLNSKYIGHVKDRLGHDFRYSLDGSKLHKLGWSPGTSFREGLEKTLSFYRRNR
ncbi:dTDP-glucose 4,6-dehydratase [Candidatus Parcubacteria bacterium]|nr:dTDP-glucose 4,6-dehydratase [Candidatus Parcubacteria bacterium]